MSASPESQEYSHLLDFPNHLPSSSTLLPLGLTSQHVSLPVYLSALLLGQELPGQGPYLTNQPDTRARQEQKLTEYVCVCDILPAIGMPV